MCCNKVSHCLKETIMLSLTKYCVFKNAPQITFFFFILNPNFHFSPKFPGHLPLFILLRKNMLKADRAFKWSSISSSFTQFPHIISRVRLLFYSFIFHENLVLRLFHLFVKHFMRGASNFT